MVDKQLNEEELEKVDGGLSFATKTCPDCGAKVGVIYEKKGMFNVITSGKCSCGYSFVKQ